ncbi:hypothetical protein KKF34_04035 [Myxococcota bacterium]|nr:hypothetical protein [Myxococcota bacterium]MBU1496026.1 hypothetical protein [Myxococcota bacterium]
MLKKKDLKYFPQIPVVGLIFIYFITLSFCIPFWFLNNLRAVNRISSRPKISEKWFVALLLFIIITIIGSFINKMNSTLFSTLFAFSELSKFVVFFITLYLNLELKKRIEGLTEGHLQLNIVLMFFFNVFYVQYKINRIPTGKKKKTEAPGNDGE